MKKNIIIKSNLLLLLGILFIISSCERDISDDATLATFPKNGNVFIDGFSSGLEYLPFGDSFFAAFSVDTDTKYDGTSAMRFDVPNVNDPNGAYAGAIFPDYGRRDLSDFDALTFWAKATKKGTINEIGFGQDFEENKYLVTYINLELTTNWRQYTIAIPDASKLTAEAGLFWYAEGPEDDEGYSFWVDELKFEKLGTIAQPRPSIFNGADVTISTSAGITNNVVDLKQTLNLENGQDQTVTVAPAYFEFSSSDPAVATVDEQGVITALTEGEAVITATLNGVEAQGSAIMNIVGSFDTAPIPTQDPNDVISIFSDAYINIPVDYYNGYWLPFSTTQGQDDINVNGDNIIAYTELNFVGIQFLVDVPTINAATMTHLHVDVQPREDVDPGDYLIVRVADVGPDNEFGTDDDTSGDFTISSSNLVNGEWYSLDIPFSELPGLAGRSNLSQFVFVSDATISSLYVDNVYFYDNGGVTPTEPSAAPTPTQDDVNVISLFSNAYTNVGVDTWRTDWSMATLEDIQIDGDDTKKYTELDFVGVETVGGNLIDASGMTHFRMDVWTPNMTTFRIKLVDFGADGEFAGGDDSEHEVVFENPAQGQWVSYDIPLSDFQGLTSSTNMAQFIFSGLPAGGGTIYVDNVYFYAE